MSLNKKIILAVSLLLLAIFIGVPAFLMFRGISKFGSAKNELNMTVRSLRSFYNKNPFPSQANIKKEKENLAVMRSWFEKLLNRLVKGQIEEVESTPTSFMTRYSDIRNKIIQKANKTVQKFGGDKATKVIDDDNPLGFDYYASGELPAPEDVPRLTQQLLMIEKLSTILIDSKVKKIVAVDREKFDSGGAAKAAATTTRRRGRRGFSAAQQNSSDSQRKTIRKTDIYEVQEFTLEFKAKEDVAMDVFNRLARDDMFIVIKSIEFDKQGPDLHMPDMEVSSGENKADDSSNDALGMLTGSSDTAVKKDDEIPIRQQRRVSGPSVDIPMDITVKVDVYTFFKDKIEDNIKKVSKFSG